MIKKNKTNPADKLFERESLRTNLTETSDKFVAVWRNSSVAGVGVIDLYYMGSVTNKSIANYMLLIQSGLRVGDNVVWGASLADLCVLGWSMDSRLMVIPKPDGSLYYGWQDPLGDFKSCDEAVLWQRVYVGLPIPKEETNFP